ncbi:uncharacterized protein PV09_00146 [Verruconis gallopava]|uniref:SET domain-containing protein n=1 Tax=Verruconis gallopava TaxID=253628 RepID=A0A0D2BCT1_9PEZI|nr:uncharacterized protein PV09_00146 [Verruconis gallopava]KIW09219.1 hypothetical protein PV09_00146 [Verruconis gallopava]
MKTLATFLCIAGLVHAISIVDFDTCSIPYIIPLILQNACDRSDEYLNPVNVENAEDISVIGIAPPNNITAAGIRTTPNRWTHEPFCIESAEANNGFCVYTNDRFANGRGISIVTTPKEVASLLEAAAFKEPSDSEIFKHPEGNAYKQQPQVIPGKGRGVLANATLNRGDYLQGYTPILLFQDDFMQFVKLDDRDLLIRLAIQRLSPKTQELFNSLHNHFPGDPSVSRIKTNAFQAYAGAAKDHFWAIIPEAARYNHDCRPNTAYYFDKDSLTHRIHAMTRINPGEEITVTYTPGGMKHAERRTFIEREWGFKCTCSKCSAPKSLVELADLRLDTIKQIEKELNDISPRRTATTATAETLVSLYEQEHLYTQIGQAYMYAALEYSYIGDKDGLRKWVPLALEALALWKGESHQFYRSMVVLSVAPEEHRSWKYIVNGFTLNDGSKIEPLKPVSQRVLAPGGQEIEALTAA